MKPKIGGIRTIAQRFNGEEWVNCLQRLPKLSDEEINKLSEKHLDMDWQTGVIDFARAIEERHGIK